MKLLSCILLLGCLQLSAGMSAQGISLSLTDASLPAVFTQIEHQTSFKFIYSTEKMLAAAKVSITVQNAPLDKILEICFKDQPLTYTIEEKFIIVKSKELKNSKVAPVDNDVHGFVRNDKDEPLPGATVMIKGTLNAVATDSKGAFVITRVPFGALLRISSIGYESQDIVIGNNRMLMIHLQTAVSALDEIILKGYYNTSKRLNTGNVARVSTVEIEQQSTANPLQAIAGRVAGIEVTQSTGFPGSKFTVNIRGVNSIASGNTPFYIIDGVPFTSGSIASEYTSSATFGGSPLSTMNPSDIESIEVLKDADATAIYGSRGANGVILITTKKGKAGKTKLEAGFSEGFGTVARRMKVLNTKQYLTARHEAFANDGAIPAASSDPDLLLWDTTRSTDWQQYATGHTAHTTHAQATISGGTASTQFLVGMGYNRESTVFNGDYADSKASVHFNINSTSANQKFKINFSGNYIAENNKLPLVDITGQLLTLPPDAPQVYNTDGSLNWNDGFRNPFGYLLDKYKTSTDNLISNLVLSYAIAPGLELKTSLGYSKLTLKEIATVPKTSFNPAYNVPSGYADFANASNAGWIAEPQLQYQTSPGKPGVFSFLLGASFQANNSSAITQEGNAYATDELLENIAAASSVQILKNTAAQYRYNAFFGRLHYSMQDRYLINFTARRDGSSRFGPGRQFANFGAVGAAWIFSREKFMQQALPFISFGKLRASYGSTGNDQIPDYGYLSLWTPTRYPYQSTIGLTPSRAANPDYGWETTRKMEIGMELGVLKDRLLFNVSYYRNRSGNQLVGSPLPVFTGQYSVQANLPALVQNSGFEFELNTTVLQSAAFTWSASVNLTIPKNKLLAFPGLDNSVYRNSYVIGQSLYVRRLFHSTGVNAQTGLYEFQDVDHNGNGTDDPADYQYLKQISKQYYGGWQNTFRYKNFKLDVLFQFVHQQGYNYLYSGFDVPGTFGNQPAYILDRWQKPGDQKPIQRLTQDVSNPAYDAYSYQAFYADGLIGDASYIRLRNIYLSYEMGSKVLKKIGMNVCRIYMSAQNGLTLTHYKGVDPESLATNYLPPLKYLTTGVQFTF